jgi:mono/diheme cytochrome c family protein
MQILKSTTFIILSAALIGASSLAACQQTQVRQSDSQIDSTYLELGEEIARKNCASCHSIDVSGASPRPDAQPLRSVFVRRSAESLADDFREHIHVGHADMPDYDFTVKETEGMLAYLASIQVE